MLEDSRCNRMVGMRGQPGIAHVAYHLVGGQILGQRTGAIEVGLHASVERRQPPLQHASLINRKVECRRTAIRKKRMRTLGGGIHAMALKLRARHRSGDELARRNAGTHTVECLERQDGTQTQRIAPKDACHGVIHHEQRTGLTRRPTQRTQIGHT